jgi:hypothetical protein
MRRAVIVVAAPLRANEERLLEPGQAGLRRRSRVGIRAQPVIAFRCGKVAKELLEPRGGADDEQAAFPGYDAPLRMRHPSSARAGACRATAGSPRRS